MQLFGLVNTMLSHDRTTAERALSIARYAVIPLSPNSGAAPMQESYRDTPCSYLSWMPGKPAAGMLHFTVPQFARFSHTEAYVKLLGALSAVQGTCKTSVHNPDSMHSTCMRQNCLTAYLESQQPPHLVVSHEQNLVRLYLE